MSATPHYIRDAEGALVPPSFLKPEDISLLALAQSLSKLCRFTGHTREFYSSAQHAVLMCQHLKDGPRSLRAATLLHDASDAFVGDISAPVKYDPAFDLETFRAMEKSIQSTIFRAFDLYPTPDELATIKRLDQVMCHAEHRDLMKVAEPHHRREADLAGIAFIRPVICYRAENLFLREAMALGLRSPRP